MKGVSYSPLIRTTSWNQEIHLVAICSCYLHNSVTIKLKLFLILWGMDLFVFLYVFFLGKECFCLVPELTSSRIQMWENP